MIWTKARQVTRRLQVDTSHYVHLQQALQPPGCARNFQVLRLSSTRIAELSVVCLHILSYSYNDQHYRNMLRILTKSILSGQVIERQIVAACEVKYNEKRLLQRKTNVTSYYLSFPY